MDEDFCTSLINWCVCHTFCDFPSGSGGNRRYWGRYYRICYSSDGIFKRKYTEVFLQDSERLLSTVGPLSMLPMLLASLGAVFTAAGVGEVISEIVGNVIPKGNVNVGIIVFAIGMALFTMIMGNAFAAITVMTVGIGAPFVLQYGADPVVIGMLARDLRILWNALYTDGSEFQYCTQ